jgi:imidazolonepropionase-like amidohydrolase
VRPVTVRTTFLAHALPGEYAGEADKYIALVCDAMLPAIAAAGLVDAVDAFLREYRFQPGPDRTVFEAATACRSSFTPNSEPAWRRTAARYGALSADHLEYLTMLVAAMAELPGPSRRCSPALSISSAKPDCRPSPRCARPAYRSHRDRLQSRHFTPDVDPADDEHGSGAVRPHRR